MHLGIYTGNFDMKNTPILLGLVLKVLLAEQNLTFLTSNAKIYDQ